MERKHHGQSFRQRTQPSAPHLGRREPPRLTSHTDKENEPLALPRLNNPTTTVHNDKRNIIVLSDFVQRYFRRKSQSSCLQYIPNATMMDEEHQRQRTHQQIQKPHRQVNRLYKGFRKRNIKSVQKVLAAPSNKSCIDYYFNVE